MKHRIQSFMTLALVVTMAGVATARDNDVAEKRSEIDATATEALDTVLAGSPEAGKLYDRAYGYAVFDNLKVQFVVSGGGGAGVAVAKASGTRTYMKMGTGGIGLGLGGQKYQVVFFMEDERTFDRFVKEGWHADTGAQAAAGTKGVAAEATFTNGVAIYQITDKGLLASADVTGTKYWAWKKLN